MREKHCWLANKPWLKLRSMTVCVHRTRRCLQLKLRHLVWTLNLRRAQSQRWLLHEGIKLLIIPKKKRLICQHGYVCCNRNRHENSVWILKLLHSCACRIASETWASWWGYATVAGLCIPQFWKWRFQSSQLLYYCSTRSCHPAYYPILFSSVMGAASPSISYSWHIWPRPCLDDTQIPSFFTLSPSHQFLAACMEY